MSHQPVTILFDVNETLSDQSTIADAFVSLGAERSLATTWFASVLRDGFALTAVGSDASFLQIAEDEARSVLHGVPLDRPLDEAVNAVMEAFSSVSLHPDVADGIRALHAEGHRLFTLSNGSTDSAKRLLGDAGLLDAVDDLLSVVGHSPWKPARASYLDALERTGAERTVYLAAVHPWDVHGAAAAGLSTIWIDRTGAPYPSCFTAPTIVATTIGGIVEQLARHSAE